MKNTRAGAAAVSMPSPPPTLSNVSNDETSEDNSGGKTGEAVGRAVTPTVTVSQCSTSTSSSSVSSSAASNPRATSPSASSNDPSHSELYPPASLLAAVDARNYGVLEAALSAASTAKNGPLDVSKALHAVLHRIPSSDDVQPNTEWDEEVRTALADPTQTPTLDPLFLTPRARTGLRQIIPRRRP